MMGKIALAGRSTRHTRPENQDRLSPALEGLPCFLPMPACVGIADGMGGTHNGGQAAEIALADLPLLLDPKALLSAVQAFQPSSPITASEALRRLSAPWDALLPSFSARLQRYLSWANQRIIRQNDGPGVSGSTLSCLVLTQDEVALGHVGDTRVYLCREDHVFQITTDHTPFEDLLAEGWLAFCPSDLDLLSDDKEIFAASSSPSWLYKPSSRQPVSPGDTALLSRCLQGKVASLQASGSLLPAAPLKNRLTLALGKDPSLPQDALIPPWPPSLSPRPSQGDLFLLCTDGLHGPLASDLLHDRLKQIARRIEDASSDLSVLDWACESLLEDARQALSRDNISFLLVSVLSSPPSDDRPTPISAEKTETSAFEELPLLPFDDPFLENPPPGLKNPPPAPPFSKEGSEDRPGRGAKAVGVKNPPPAPPFSKEGSEDRPEQKASAWKSEESEQEAPPKPRSTGFRIDEANFASSQEEEQAQGFISQPRPGGSRSELSGNAVEEEIFKRKPTIAPMERWFWLAVTAFLVVCLFGSLLRSGGTKNPEVKLRLQGKPSKVPADVQKPSGDPSLAFWSLRPLPPAFQPPSMQKRLAVLESVIRLFLESASLWKLSEESLRPAKTALVEASQALERLQGSLEGQGTSEGEAITAFVRACQKAMEESIAALHPMWPKSLTDLRHPPPLPSFAPSLHLPPATWQALRRKAIQEALALASKEGWKTWKLWIIAEQILDFPYPPASAVQHPPWRGSRKRSLQQAYDRLKQAHLWLSKEEPLSLLLQDLQSRLQIQKEWLQTSSPPEEP